MFLVHRRGLARDGDNPVYLTGYGGFNISMTPAFSRSLLLWLEQGGVVAIPNIRGGGEYGEAWHQGGMLGQKQNSFDDFIAAAEWLIRERYTRPERLAAAGGSNGGLLMGAVLTQRPELFGAVVIQVPLLDMLRYHRFLIARLWIPEYGSADDPEQFRWLRAYSPYHHVRDGRGLSGGAARDRGERHPGRSDARPQDGGAAAGGDLVGPAGAAPPGGAGRARRRQAARQGAGRADRHLDVCVFGVGGRGLDGTPNTEESSSMAYRARSPVSIEHAPPSGSPSSRIVRGALLREVPGHQDEHRAAGRGPAVAGACRSGGSHVMPTIVTKQASDNPILFYKQFLENTVLTHAESVRAPHGVGRDGGRARAHAGLADRPRVAGGPVPGDQLRPGHAVDVARAAGLSPVCSRS